VNGHPAWATEYDTATNTFRAMDVKSNAFCAGGNVLGNGTWLNVGGNQAVGPGGLVAVAGGVQYGNTDGGEATRLLDTCSDDTCDWVDNGSNYMTTRRWYPTLETLPDGTMIVIGGCDWGGYVNDKTQNNPTYEFYPSRGGPIGLNFLLTTLPANLYPLTWLLPSGKLNSRSLPSRSRHHPPSLKPAITLLTLSLSLHPERTGNLFIQANLGTEIFDYINNVEYPLPDIPHAVRTYPGSAATAMLPLTPANNWTAQIMFCGGTDLQPDQWVTTWNIASYPADSTCVSMTPDVSTAWVDEEPLPEGRVMGNWIFLPDGRLVLINGIGKGTAGYGNNSWTIGQSFGDKPVHSVHYYDHNAPVGSRFSASVAESTVDRMYHSSATLLPDGSVLSSGSNPNADYVAAGTPGYKYVTEYRVERFYPDFFNATRPQPTSLPSKLSYGGAYFDVHLDAASVGSASNLDNTKVTIVRPGFSTHAMNMGQRFVQLANSFTFNANGTATLHVAQLPPNPNIIAPGPALIFVVVNGVPSVGQWVMLGSGKLGTQKVSKAATLPANVGEVKGGSQNQGDGPMTQTHSGDERVSPTGAAAAKVTGKQDTSGAVRLSTGILAGLGAVAAGVVGAAILL